jgi:hypothetical protein
MKTGHFLIINGGFLLLSLFVPVEEDISQIQAFAFGAFIAALTVFVWGDK